ncbi:MAG TPA: phosphoribosylanthranilate isomerase [Gammaproteobacteria bacterium]
MSTRIKICGITRPDDARIAAQLGADAIGLVFAESSPRRIGIAQAAEIAASVPGGVRVVGLFLDAEEDFVRSVLAAVRVDVLQFHGRESAGYCARFGLPYFKTIGVADRQEAARAIAQYPDACALLFDSHAHGAAGGTGKTADWHALPAANTNNVILAGGLKPGNVFDAVCLVRPHGVDVSSGVESRPGLKDRAKIKEFISEVRRADAATT